MCLKISFRSEILYSFIIVLSIMGLEIFAFMLATSQLAIYGLVIGKSLVDKTKNKVCKVSWTTSPTIMSCFTGRGGETGLVMIVWSACCTY